jgi:hypothetical protein
MNKMRLKKCNQTHFIFRFEISSFFVNKNKKTYDIRTKNPKLLSCLNQTKKNPNSNIKYTYKEISFFREKKYIHAKSLE